MPIDKNADNIQVLVRVRPLNSREREEDAKPCIKVNEDGSLTLDTKPEPKKFTFDWIGAENTTQHTIFTTVGEPMIAACLEGFNCCIFAYGQTGAGKTFTMQGRGLDSDVNDVQTRGLQPRVFDYIFKRVQEETRADRNVEYLISSTYLEIYNEHIKDLLDPTSGSLQIREDVKKGVYVEGLKEETVRDSSETLELLKKGARNRHVGSTNMNAESSRSHSVFSMTIESKKNIGGAITIRSSKFHFVDLAGSERQKQTAAAGDRLKEASNINKSLTVLGKVINTLVENAQGKSIHVPYRESKLTFLLKDSLGGNSKTCIIANVSPASSAFSETLSTLKFAQNAKQIKNKASINEDSLGGVEQLKNEIKRLKEELLSAQNVITNLKKEGTQKSLSPNLTPQTICFSEKQIYAENQRALKVEEALRENIKLLAENEIALQAELAKKEEYVRIFQSAEEFYTQTEIHYKTIISLQSERNLRISKVLEASICQVDINVHLLEENGLLKRENTAFIQIFRTMPTITATFIKNVSLQELLDGKEGESNPNSSLSVAVQLQESIFSLENLNCKLEESIKDRKALSEKIERVTGGKGIKSPSKEQREKEEAEQQLVQLKQQLGSQIDSLKFQISNMKVKETETEKLLTQEKEKSSKLSCDYEKAVAEKIKIQKMYEERIRSLINHFENTKSATASEMEKKFNEQNLRNLELKNRVQDINHELEQARTTIEKSEIQIKALLAEKQNLEEKLKKCIEDSSQENHKLQKLVNEFDGKIKVLMGQLSTTREENENFMKKIEEILAENNAYALALNDYLRTTEELRMEIDDLKSKTSEEVDQKDRELVKQREAAEIADTERKKLQEELETVNQVIAYNNAELEKKKEQVTKLSNQNSHYHTDIENLKGQLNHREQLVATLESKITQLTNDATSSFQNVLRENKKLQSELEDLKVKLEKECAHSSKQSLEITNLKQALVEKEKSETNFRIAYQEAIDRLQKINLELKNKDNELRKKELDYQDLENQLQKVTEQYNNECSQANEKIARLVSEITGLQKNVNESYLKNKTLEENFQKAESHLKSQIEQHVTEKKMLCVEIESISQTFARECELMTKRLTEQEERHAKSIGELSHARKELELSLERSSSWFQTASKKHLESIKNIQGEIDGLERLQIATEERGEIAGKQLQQLKHLLEAARTELNLKTEQLEALQSASKDSQEFVLNQSKQLSALQEELAHEQKNHSELTENYRQLEATLQRELEIQSQLKEQKINLEQKNQQLEEILQEEKKFSTRSQEEAITLKQQLEEQASNFEREFNEFKATVTEETSKEIHNRNESIGKLEAELKDKETELEANKEKLKQIAELEKQSEENQALKQQVEMQNEKIEKLGLQMNQSLNALEEELAQIRVYKQNLEGENQFVMATVSIKDSELEKCREEIRLMLIEKNCLLSEINTMKSNDKKAKKTIEELEAKASLLASERLALLLRVDELSKFANNQFGQFGGPIQSEQKLKQLREENAKFRAEKLMMGEKLNRVLDRNDHLQKKIDELARRLHIDPQKVTEEIEQDTNLQAQLEKTMNENKYLYDAFSKLNQLMKTNFGQKKQTSSIQEKLNLEATLNEAQELLNFFAEKERDIRNRENEIIAKELEYNITKKDFAIIKQKYQLTHSTYFTQMNQPDKLLTEADVGKENAPLLDNQPENNNLDFDKLLDMSLEKFESRIQSAEPSSLDFEKLLLNTNFSYGLKPGKQQKNRERKNKLKGKDLKDKYGRRQNEMMNQNFKNGIRFFEKEQPGTSTIITKECGSPSKPQEEKIHSGENDQGEGAALKSGAVSFEEPEIVKKIRTE